jgi:hypothetical protein
VAAPPASAAVRGVDMNLACDVQAPGTYLVLRNNTVYGWKCATGIYDLGISVDRACRYQYGSGSSAYYTSYDNPNSWLCR